MQLLTQSVLFASILSIGHACGDDDAVILPAEGEGCPTCTWGEPDEDSAAPEDEGDPDGDEEEPAEDTDTGSGCETEGTDDCTYEALVSLYEARAALEAELNVLETRIDAAETCLGID
jgi:hypothetical protein